jgi:hypothetical protein
MDKNRELIYQLYEERGELLDMRSFAALNEQPWYLQKELASVDDQIKTVDHITDESQADYFAGVGELHNTSDIVTVKFNPALNSGGRFTKITSDQCPNYTGRTRNADPTKLQPYIAGGTRHAIADDHEIHSWTADGE